MQNNTVTETQQLLGAAFAALCMLRLLYVLKKGILKDAFGDKSMWDLLRFW
jgi:hypothetical protein